VQSFLEHDVLLKVNDRLSDAVNAANVGSDCLSLAKLHKSESTTIAVLPQQNGDLIITCITKSDRFSYNYKNS